MEEKISKSLPFEQFSRCYKIQHVFFRISRSCKKPPKKLRHCLWNCDAFFYRKSFKKFNSETRNYDIINFDRECSKVECMQELAMIMSPTKKILWLHFFKFSFLRAPGRGGGPYKFPQVDWLLPVHGPLREVEARA